MIGAFLSLSQNIKDSFLGNWESSGREKYKKYRTTISGIICRMVSKWIQLVKRFSCYTGKCRDPILPIGPSNVYANFLGAHTTSGPVFLGNSASWRKNDQNSAVTTSHALRQQLFLELTIDWKFGQDCGKTGMFVILHCDYSWLHGGYILMQTLGIENMSILTIDFYWTSARMTLGNSHKGLWRADTQNSRMEICSGAWVCMNTHTTVQQCNSSVIRLTEEGTRMLAMK